jgi:hypothetical protein
MPTEPLKVRVPQIINSVSVDVTESMKIKGSSLYASMMGVHSWRAFANFLNLHIKSGKVLPTEQNLKLVKFFDSFTHLVRM